MSGLIHKLAIALICALTWSGSASADFSRTFIDAQPLLSAPANGVELAYRDIGGKEQPVVLLVMGLGASHIAWGDDFVAGLRDRGYRVLMIDNRDVGGSTSFEDWGQPTLWWQFLKNALGFEVDAPYTLNDMADDAVALMDTLEIPEVHVVGASMGGMIAQIIAARHPERVSSLTSIMSTPGDPDLPPPTGEASSSLQSMAEGGADEAAREDIRNRGFYPSAMPRQMMAILKTGDRSEEVATISVPTLVIHGEQDTLIPVAHGRATARLIDGSRLVTYPDMAHNLPDEVVPLMLAEMGRLIGRPAVGAPDSPATIGEDNTMPGDNLFGPVR